MSTHNTYSTYKKAKGDYRNLLKQTEFNFYENLIYLSSNEYKTMWSIVNRETGRKLPSRRDIELNLDAELCWELVVVIYMFANHFSFIAELQRHFDNLVSRYCTSSSLSDKTFSFIRS